MDLGRVTAAMIHDKYSRGFSAFCRSIPDAKLRGRFEREADPFMRACAAGVWAQGAEVKEPHLAAVNGIYMDGNPPPAILYWELVSLVGNARAFEAPGFFLAMIEYDAARKTTLAARFAELFSLTLLFFAAVDETVTLAEGDYIAQCCRVLSRACEAGGLPRLELGTGVYSYVTEKATDSPGGAQTIGREQAKAEGEKAAEAEPPPDLDALLRELDELCGLEQIKRDVRSLINLVKVRRLRQENALPVPPMSLHLVFLGNPGTGKTTVARLLSKLYRAIGVLSKGHLVETDRSGLVAGFVGQTAIKTGEVLKSSIGGVLFIDEAYALARQEGGNDFGQEAVEVLLKGMEDHRDDLIVIVAGYSALMERFIHSNPGLESRFNRYFYFEDYTGEQLNEIFLSLCKKNGYEADEGAKSFARELFGKLYEERDENFGNAREVRNLFEKAVSRQADRVAALECPTKEALMTLTEADLRAAEEFYEAK